MNQITQYLRSVVLLAMFSSVAIFLTAFPECRSMSKNISHLHEGKDKKEREGPENTTENVSCDENEAPKMASEEK